MALRPPKDPVPGQSLITVAEAWQARDGTAYNVMGVVTDYLPSAQSRGTDYSMRLHLWDASCLTDSFDTPATGMPVRIFRKSLDEMPLVEDVGDVVLFRKLRTKAPKGSQWTAISSHDTAWLVLPVQSLMDSTDPEGADVAIREPAKPKSSHIRTVSTAEIKYAKELLRLKDPSTLIAPPKSTALDRAQIIKASGGKEPAYKGKHRNLADLTWASAPCFVDLFGEIKKVFDSGRQVVEMQLTDYTECEGLYDHPYELYKDTIAMDGKCWRGPFGKRTITLNLWDEHATYLRELAQKKELFEGGYVQVKNVQIKTDRNGQQLEGHCRGGSSWGGSGISLHRPREAEYDDKMKNLLKLKKEYLELAKENGWSTEKDPWTESKKRSAPSANHDNSQPQPDDTAKSEQPAKKSKNAGKNKKARAKAAALKAATKPDSTDATTKAPTNSLNEHIHTENINVPLTSILSILNTELLARTTSQGNRFSLPFQNCKYKSRVQAFDFFPDNLEDFAVPYRISEFDILNEDSDSESQDHSNRIVSPEWAADHPDAVSWKWHFFLFVSDPRKPRQGTDSSFILLQAADMDADYLLNMEACDLRTNPSELVKLKEKLFVLWGNLEELKNEHGKSGEELRKEGVDVSSRPFECFIKEYGVQRPGQDEEPLWERSFGIFGTRIC